MAIVYKHLTSVAWLRTVSVGLDGQQGIEISARAVGLTSKLDATEITLRASSFHWGLQKPAPDLTASADPFPGQSQAYDAQVCSSVVWA